MSGVQGGGYPVGEDRRTTFDRATVLVRRALEVVIAGSLAVMVALVFGNVVLRYGFNSGLVLSEELSRLLFVWLIFLGAILASLEHAHIGVDLLVRRLPMGGRRALIALTGALMLALCGFLVVGCWRQMTVNFDNFMPVSGVPYAVLYAAGLVGGIGLIVSIGRNVWAAFDRSRTAADMVMVHASEEEALIADAVEPPESRER